MCIFHKWGMWAEYTVIIPERKLSQKWALAACVEYRQKRTCEKCGLTQDKLIREVVTP